MTPLIRTLLILALSSPLAGGALTLVSEPDATVVWDGVELGRTDLQGRLNVSGIPPGDYEITISKPGFRTLRRRIEVASGHRDERLPLAPVAQPPSRVAPSPAASLQPTTVLARVPEEAMLSVPSSSVVEERRASQVVDGMPFEMPWAWVLPPAGLLAAVLVWLLRARPGRLPASVNGVDGPEFYDPFAFAEDRPPQSASASTSFLDDLRRREEMAERGVDLPPAEDWQPAIDIDGDDVRSIEDPESS